MHKTEVNGVIPYTTSKVQAPNTSRALTLVYELWACAFIVFSVFGAFHGRCSDRFCTLQMTIRCSLPVAQLKRVKCQQQRLTKLHTNTARLSWMWIIEAHGWVWDAWLIAGGPWGLSHVMCVSVFSASVEVRELVGAFQATYYITVTTKLITKQNRFWATTLLVLYICMFWIPSMFICGAGERTIFNSLFTHSVCTAMFSTHTKKHTHFNAYSFSLLSGV